MNHGLHIQRIRVVVSVADLMAIVSWLSLRGAYLTVAIFNWILNRQDGGPLKGPKPIDNQVDHCWLNYRLQSVVAKRGCG